MIDKIKRDREAGVEPITPEKAALLAADELAEAVAAEARAWTRYLSTPRDRGGDLGPNGRAKRAWHEVRDRVEDALAAWNAATKGDQTDD